MPSDNLDDAIRVTQQTLGSIFSKPKCSSKLLAKPPFRFIHDIVSATKKSTGFPNKYFTREELNSANLKSKENKVAFLKKFIHLVSICQGSLVDIRPSKVVAGLEPLNTNILLTLFGKIAVDTAFDHDAAIAFILSGGEVGKLPQTIVDVSVDEGTPEGKITEPRPSDDAKGYDARIGIGVERKNGQPDLDTPLHVENEAKSHELQLHVDEPDEKNDATRTLDNNESSLQDFEAQIEQCNSDIAQTQIMVSKLISKPKCTDKLLGKPPFRFIHDVIMAIGKVTDMNLHKILSQDEMDSSKVREKKSKVAFLTTLTAHIEHDLGVTVDLNPSKVVAGLEADKTRYFFQLLVVAATKTRNLMSKMEIEMPEQVASLDIEGDLNATETEKEASFNHHQSKDDSTNELTKSIHVDKPSLLLQNESKESDQTEANQPTEDYQDNLADLETKENPISKTGMDKFVNDDTSSTLMQGNPKNDNDAHEKIMNMDTTKLSGHEGIQSSDFQNDDGVSMKNEEESKTDRATIIDAHMAHNKIQKPNRRKNEESIQQLFFGLEEDEIDKDRRNPAPAKARPKTARRKPPKVKERENLNNQNLISRSTRKKPVVFRDDEADDPRKEDTTDEAKMDDLLDTHNLRKNHTYHHNEKIQMRLNLAHHDRRGDSKISSTKLKVTPYDLGAIAASIQNLAKSTAPIGKALDYIPREAEKMNKERAYWSQAYDTYVGKFKEMKHKIERDLEPLSKEEQDIDDEIQRIKQLSHETNMEIEENNKRIRSRLSYLIS